MNFILNFEKSKKVKLKKSYFGPFTSGWSIVLLMASELYFHFLANGRYDGDLFVRQILLNVPVYV